MDEMVEAVKTKVVRVADEGFETEYNSAVERKSTLRAELEAKMEQEFAVKSEVFDKIIALTSHEEEVPVEDEEVSEETTEETVGE